MRPTLDYIHQKFEEFNHLCFDDRLPPLPIVLSNAKTYLGVCAYKTKRDLLMRKRHYDFRLRISTRFDLPEDVIEDTILHEMIHYYIAYHHLKDTSTHGRLFRQMMSDINTRFGRHITISHRLSDEERQKIKEEDAKRAARRRTYYCVAVMQFKDHRVGIKVIPRSREHIETFRSKLYWASEVESVSFYVTADPFFSRYPRSMALKAYFIDETLLRSHLEQAVCLT